MLLIDKCKTERVTFAGHWEEFFAKFDLRSFDNFFDYSAGQVVSHNHNRNVVEFTLNDGPVSKTFFIKKFHSTHYKDILSAWSEFGRPVSQAAVEWNNANLLLENKIGTYIPVCFGIKNFCGFENKSFIVTEKLASIPLSEFVTRNWLSLNSTGQKQVLSAVAKFVRRIHALDVSMPDLSMWHIFVPPDNFTDQCQYSIIDLHRMTRNVSGYEKKIKDLGKLYWSMSPKYFTDEMKDFFINEYMDNMNGQTAILIKKVLRYAAVTASRRHLPY
jgi:hypothetical protein